jgi:hypothetical protein
MGLSGEVVDVLVEEFVPAAVQPLLRLFTQACSNREPLVEEGHYQSPEGLPSCELDDAWQ